MISGIITELAAIKDTNELTSEWVLAYVENVKDQNKKKTC